MKVVLVRHGIAEERDDFASSGQPDELRPLTDNGASRMKRAARGIRELMDSLDLIATSPLTRANQTAQILGKQYKDVPIVVVPALSPEHDFDGFLDWLRKLEDAGAVAAVGHEPHLSSLVSWLLTGNGASFFEMKKGSAVLIEFEGEVRAGGAQLRWFLTPSQLRLIGD